MKNIKLNKEDIIKIYDELERRLIADVIDYREDNGEISIREIREMFKERIQGVYGTIMAIVSNENWQEIVRWADEIEKERYW